MQCNDYEERHMPPYKRPEPPPKPDDSDWVKHVPT
jgi:hypothetical protein